MLQTGFKTGSNKIVATTGNNRRLHLGVILIVVHVHIGFLLHTGVNSGIFFFWGGGFKFIVKI